MKQTLKKHLINLRGQRLNEKFLVLESDDWGAIRIPNIKVRDWLYEKNYINKKDPFSHYDTLESENDYEALFEVLNRFIDCRGNHPILTANFIMNNPDFDAIKSNDFKQYYSQPFTETYKSYYGSSKTEEILREGIKNNLVKPQFHGTEHLNVVKWMNYLNQNNASFREAFDLKCYAIDDLSSNNRRGNLMAAYDYDTNEELEYIRKSIFLGLEQFEEIFGFKSNTTIAPCYVWNDEIEKIMQKNKVSCFQGSYVQNIPMLKGSFRRKYRFTGQKNDNDQTYLIRNGLFEPSVHKNIDWVNKCLESIAIAFKWGKPAIISTHRINFVGGLDENQRNHNLKLLKEVITKAILKWPDIQFIDSESLSLKNY